MKRRYPKVLDEETTIAQCQTRSIARFGDGEWRCAVDGGCTSQRPSGRLANELRKILANPMPDRLMVAIPNPFHEGAPRRESWIKYTEMKFASLLTEGTPYASSFITRPDNAPWIDTPAYWESVRDLWRGKHVVLVVGTEKDGVSPERKSLNLDMMADAASISTVLGPRQHAYDQVDRIEKEAFDLAHRHDVRDSRVLMCLGTTATVLAYRLTRMGIHALDLGHIGMFMRHAGAYRYGQDDVASSAYRQQLVALHERQKWGADGGKHAAAVVDLWERYKPKTVLDYGCGENVLAELVKGKFRVSGYDPGIPARAAMPKPCDMVVCTDVLEHVEPEKLDAVLDHIWRLTSTVAYFVIDVKPANAVLPDGRNAHLSLHHPVWWFERLKQIGWTLVASQSGGKSVTFVAEKQE